MLRLISKALLVVALLIGVEVCANEYPVGDILPEVVVNEGQFEVYFTTWQVSDGAPWNKVYRTIFSAEGKLIAEREPFSGKVPEYNGVHDMEVVDGMPSLRLIPNGQKHWQVIKPQVPPGSYADCALVCWLSDSRFVMRDSPAKPGKDWAWPFSLRIFDPHSGEVLASTVLGTPGRMLDWAMTSPALPVDDDLLIAWMEQRRFPDGVLPGGRDSIYRMVLTRWRPKLGKTQHTVVAPAIDDNVSISIGRIGHVILIAWHEVGKIRYRAIDLRNTRFVSRLPELRLDEKMERSVLRELGR